MSEITSPSVVRETALDVAVIFVSFNSSEVISQAISPLLPLLDHGGEIIVVDNSSVDSTVEVVRTLDVRIKILEMSANLGFAAAVNIGVRESKSAFVCTLNPDARLSPDALRYIVDILRADSSIGLAAPLVRQRDGVAGNSGAGMLPTVWRTICTLWGLSLLAGPRWLEGTVLLERQVKIRRDVDWLTGACIVAPRTAWTRVGGLSEDWFMYAEDVDLGFRMKSAGLRAVVVPELVVEHEVGGSSHDRPTALESAWIVNQYEFFVSRMARWPWDPFAWKAVALVGLMVRGGVHVMISWISRSTALRSRGMWLFRCARALANA